MNKLFERFSALVLYFHFLHAKNIVHINRSYRRELHISAFLFCIRFHSVVLVVSAPVR